MFCLQGQQNGEANTIVTQSDQRGTKRPYNGADYGAGSVAADLNESNNSVFGSTLDYLYNELIRKNLRETGFIMHFIFYLKNIYNESHLADELYQEVYATVRNHTIIALNTNY